MARVIEIAYVLLILALFLLTVKHLFAKKEDKKDENGTGTPPNRS